jgi:hypothetical protein
MKKIVAIVSAVALATIIGCGKEAEAADDNWNTSEHNYNLNSGNWGVEVRTMGNDDYDHVEGKYKLSDSLELALRYAEDGVDTEIRPKLTHKIFTTGPVSLAHRIEYRYFEGTKDDSARYRAIIGLKAGNVWATLQPRWTFGAGKTGDAKIDDVKWQAGYDWTLNSDENSSVKLTPYVEYLTAGEDGDWAKTHMILGTRLAVKF